MDFLLQILLCMCLTISSLTPFSPLVYNIYSSNTHNNNDSTIIDSTLETEETESVEENKFGIDNFTTIDLEGYCTLDIPLSHFSIDLSSTEVSKKIDYKDGKSNINMGYITNIPANTDISGYITKELAKVSTVTNDSTNIQIEGTNWVRIKSTVLEDGCNVYIYYTTDENKSSAFWMKVKVTKSSDDFEFDSAITYVLSTYNLYSSGAIFDEPSGGIYGDETPGNIGDYESNQDTNTVFKSRGGYVLGANISDSWESLQIILDGTKFQLPATYEQFKSAGFYLNDYVVDSERFKLNPMQHINVQMRNANGTQIVVVFYNSDASNTVSIDKCKIVTLIINKSGYIDVNLTPSDEVYNEETAKDSNASKNAKDAYNHELILPGGITWGIFTDDIISLYGKNNFTLNNYGDSMKQLEWVAENNRLLIRTNLVNTIRYIEISCMKNIK